MSPRDLLAAVVAVEPGCRGHGLGGKLVVEGLG
jgi:predicted N-acetyltransferase YhbS